MTRALVEDSRAAIRRAKHVALFLRSSRKSKHVLLDSGFRAGVGNREVGPQVLSFGVDRIQWNFEPMRNHAENCFEL